jgi:manganese/zinc/iron transport system substrate-binding protein
VRNIKNASIKTGVITVITLMLTVGISLLSLEGCKEKKQASDKLQVVSTIGMIHDIVINIGKSHVDAISLMGPGVDPHLYKASEGDTRRLANADLILYNGLHLEARMADIIQKMSSRTQVVAVSKDIPKDQLRTPPEFDGFADPHIWFDVTLWIKVAKTIEEALVNIDPSHKDDYHKNTAEYIKSLESLHQEVRTKATSVPQEKRILVTAHDAFGYFGRQYGFKVIGLQGVSTQAEAGAKDVQLLADMIVKQKITAIFIESAVPRRHIQAVQEAVIAKGWQVKIGGELFADAMGSAGTPEGTYIGMIRHNITTITEALK